MVSIDEVARLAGVSTATVSRALSGRGRVSEASRERVRVAAASLGYVASASASSLASGRTRNVGVLVPFLDRWYFGAVLGGVSAALMRRGYDITLYAATPDAAERRDLFDTFLRRRRVDAVIALALELGPDETGRLSELGVPVLAVGGPHPRLPALPVDHFAMARTATAHLLSLGHTRIAYLGAGPEFDLDFHVPEQRRRGFEQALADAAVPVAPELLEAADFTIDGGFRAATRLLARADAHPTALFAASDEMAIGAILAARERGVRVPEDLSVIGVDGHELGEFFQLTTIDQFPRRQGERAAEAVLARLEPAASAPSVSRELPFELVVRATTAPPPARP
ncbi:LacI family DNA-binding transcriptional regulator [Microbacterium sp. RD1]|uniref:LacI family DNA-binding transcriptional regulator n=1 Tax=Microbacterium sp. RD1 TaxID=3457313 RepID=UPI003FA53738